jgi:trans-feruloyl-CoA hydratase/vanillin synthase
MIAMLDSLPQYELPSAYGAYQQLRLSRSEGILVVGLNRPAKKNAIGVEMTLEIERAMLACALDSEIQVIVFHGLGGHFSSGMDMKDFFDQSDRDPALLARARRATDNWRSRLMRNLPQARLAVVQGYCFGGAWPIVESADVVLCSEDATFGLPEINFGFVPGGPIAKTNLLCLGRRGASHAALTGLPFGAREALDRGMVTKILANPDLHREAWHLAKHLRTRLLTNPTS